MEKIIIFFNKPIFLFIRQVVIWTGLWALVIVIVHKLFF